MKPIKNEFHFGFPVNPQEKFAPYYRGSSTDVAARVESLPVPVCWGRGWMGESTRQVEGSFESLLAEAFA